MCSKVRGKGRPIRGLRSVLERPPEGSLDTGRKQGTRRSTKVSHENCGTRELLPAEGAPLPRVAV